MKLDENVLVEVVSIVQKGLVAIATGEEQDGDVSLLLRNLDLQERGDKLGLSDEYYLAEGRENPYDAGV